MFKSASEAVALEQPQAKLTATVFTVVSILITVFGRMVFPLGWWNLWIWFVCCGVVLLSVSRFSIRHVVPLPELGLLSFPFCFDFFFQRICPTAKIASVDELLWCVDANFGYPQPGWGRLLVAFPLLLWICKLVWSSLPLQFVIVYLALPALVRRRYVVAVVSTACLILPLYALCPGAGPVYLFRDHYPYPNSLPMPLLNPHRTLLPPGLLLNTTPSGHMAWALLLFWFSYKHCGKRVAACFGAIVGLTVFATLGLGEHYVIDLIVAVPFAAAVWSLVNRQWKACGALVAFVVAWLVALRVGWALLIPMPVMWLLSLVTILVSLPAAMMEYPFHSLPTKSPGIEPGIQKPFLAKRDDTGSQQAEFG